MAEAADAAAWQRTSWVLSMIAGSCGVKCRPGDFDPYAQAVKQPDSGVKELKAALGGMKKKKGNLKNSKKRREKHARLFGTDNVDGRGAGGMYAGADDARPD